LLAACTTASPEPSAKTPDIRQATLLLPGHEKPTQVSYEVIDGLAIFEGDIILGEVAEDGTMLQTQGVGREGDFFRWPGGVVPYVINSDLSSSVRARIDSAIEHWHANTNIRLVPRTIQDSFVEFRSHPSVCSSWIGKQGQMQVINLAAGCSRGAVIHEIGHAVGLWHEQSREDRDNYVEILWENIQPGKEGNFRKHITDGFDIGSYDYGSIMHYNAYAFSKNSRPTIRSRRAGVFIGQSSGLSAGDKGSVRTLYDGLNLRVTVNATTPSYPGIIVKRVATGQVVGRFTRTTTLRNLRAGDYTITAPSWDIGGPNKPVWKVYTPNPRVQKVRVPLNGKTAYSTISYTVQDLSPPPNPGPGPGPGPCIKWNCP